MRPQICGSGNQPFMMSQIDNDTSPNDPGWVLTLPVSLSDCLVYVPFQTWNIQHRISFSKKLTASALSGAVNKGQHKLFSVSPQTFMMINHRGLVHLQTRRKNKEYVHCGTVTFFGTGCFSIHLQRNTLHVITWTSATEEPVNAPLATIAVTAVSQLQGHPGVESCSLILPLSHRARGIHREAEPPPPNVHRGERDAIRCFGG